MWQFWSIEYQGKNIYLIRSAFAKNLFLGIKDNEINGKIIKLRIESKVYGRKIRQIVF